MASNTKTVQDRRRKLLRTLLGTSTPQPRPVDATVAPSDLAHFRDHSGCDYALVDVAAGDRACVEAALATLLANPRFEFPDRLRATPLDHVEIHLGKGGDDGCFDELISCSSGALYLIGFNYGH